MSDATLAIFADPASRAFEEKLDRLAPTDATILIIGETGTGKEVAARALHARSPRSTGPFVAVNCGALSETLAEAELFGHEKGAFTGALRAQPGWFEAANGGTLLLDEVGDLPLAMQVKLLRVLQEREVTRLGSRTGRRIDVRIVAATNVDLDAAVERGTFRKDLLFRLNIATVMLRPLRERRQDIEPLAQHFLALYRARFQRAHQEFAPEALAQLQRYHWPGNVRELDNVVHRAVLLNDGPMIRDTDLSLIAATPVAQTAAPPAEPADRTPAGLEATLRDLAAGWLRDRTPDLLPRAIRALVAAGYEEAAGNQVKAAELLGVSRNTMRTHLAHLGVIEPRRRVLDTDTTPWVRLRVGIQKFGASSLLRFGSELERRLAAQRILVDWRDFSTGPALLEALHAGEVDIGSVGEVPPVFAQANGAPVVYVAYESAAPAAVAIVVRRDSDVSDVADLRGLRVALNRGSNTHILLVRALEMHAMSPSDVQAVYVPHGTAAAPEVWPQADAWVMWDPYLSDVQRDGRYRVLLDGSGLVANYQFYMARREVAETLPEVIDTILDEARLVGAAATQRPAAAAHQLAGPFGMVADSVEVAIRRLSPGPRRLDGEVVREQQRIADRFYALGMLPKAISVVDAVRK